MLIQIFSYDRYRLKTNTDISINTDADTDMVLANTEMIETNTDVSVSISAKNIGQPIYQSISENKDIILSDYNITTFGKLNPIGVIGVTYPYFTLFNYISVTQSSKFVLLRLGITPNVRVV